MRKKILFLILFVILSTIFIDNIGAETYNNYVSGITSCGGGLIKRIPTIIPKVISIFYNIIQIAVPIVLVVMGSLDLLKNITAGKEDEIKKGQNLFIKRLIYAALIFVVFIIVKLLISVVADNSASKIMECAECFISNKCD